MFLRMPVGNQEAGFKVKGTHLSCELIGDHSLPGWLPIEQGPMSSLAAAFYFWFWESFLSKPLWDPCLFQATFFRSRSFKQLQWKINCNHRSSVLYHIPVTICHPHLRGFHYDSTVQQYANWLRFVLVGFFWKPLFPESDLRHKLIML